MEFISLFKIKIPIATKLAKLPANHNHSHLFTSEKTLIFNQIFSLSLDFIKSLSSFLFVSISFKFSLSFSQ
jgi:hypothetical protein